MITPRRTERQETVTAALAVVGEVARLREALRRYPELSPRRAVS